MNKVYHVVSDWDGGDIRPLADRLGEAEAIETWLRRWPDGSAELAVYHVHLVHLYATRDEAETHADVFGGCVLEIDVDAVEIKMDDLEFDHPVTRRVTLAAIIQ